MTHRMNLPLQSGAAKVRAIIILALLLAPFLIKAYGLYLLTMWVVMTIAAIGLNLTLGYAGQISLAQAAFVGIGAYTSAILTTNHYPLVVAMALALVICFGIGWLLGYPALRVQHHYLAFVTLGFSTLVFLVMRNEQWLTGGVYGISGIQRPQFLGDLLSAPIQYYFLCVAVLLVVTVAMAKLVRSPWGRSFQALRENPVRAASLGVYTRRYTLMAFAIGSALGGLAGTLYAPLVQFIDPTPFALSLSLNLLLIVIVGGSGKFYGPFIGALVAVLLPEWLRFAEGLYLIAYASIVMLLMVFYPSGLVGLAQSLFDQYANRTAATLPEPEVK